MAFETNSTILGLLAGSLLSLGSISYAADFVGTTACRGCHEQSFLAWQGSHHDQAMQPATSDTVLGDFGGAEYAYGGTTSRFYRRDDEYVVRTDGPDGELHDYPVKYTFGVTPLQQYLVPFPDGRLQALGIAWDSRPRAEGGQRWFHLYPGQDIDHRHELHWTGAQQNWNYMCASCHSTELTKGYSAESDRFDTTWHEIDVGCEACHGPGSEHLAWAGQDAEGRSARSGKGFGKFQLGRHVSWPINPETGSPMPQQAPAGDQLDVCADCHSRRGEIASDSAGNPRFLDHFMPAFLTDGLYHADGQIDDEVFVWGSFAQSRMHQAGVVCSNCHEPHSLELRAPGDAVCAQCHEAKRFASATHHHHEPAGAGASCLDCHMPASTYMVVDPRRDHSLRIPRPDLSVSLGTPNACNGCHQDQTPGWAAGHFAEWYPRRAGTGHRWAETFARARSGDPRSEGNLVDLATDGAVPPIVRGTAMLELAPFLGPASAGAVSAALADVSPLVRITGLRALEVLPPGSRYPLGRAMLNDPLLAVRAEAGRVLAPVPPDQVPDAEREQLERAVEDFIATQDYNAERPESHTNLGSLYAGRGDGARAETAYRTAIRIDGGYVPAYINLADLLRLTNRGTQAAQLLEQGLEHQPESAELHHALGLQQVRAGETDAALASLETAARLAPLEPRFAYVYAIALNSTGGQARALEVLADALARHPFDQDMLLASVTINLEMGDVPAAKRHLARTLEIRPGDPQATQLARSLGLSP